MDATHDDAPEPAREPQTLALKVAVLGNTVLAVPAPFGLLILTALVLSDGIPSDPASLAKLILVLAAAPGPVALGLYLVVGYRRTWRTGRPARRPRAFWSVSAVYNGLGVVLAVIAVWFEAREGNTGVLLVLSVPAAAWMAFMTTLSASRALRAAVYGPAAERLE